MVDQVGARVFAFIDRFPGQPRWHRDGQQVLWFDIEGPCSPCQVDVKKSGLCKGPGNVRDGGVAGSNENKFVVGVAMWLS